MTEQTVNVGRSIDDLAENGVDGFALRVIALTDLSSALYTVEQEFQHDETDEARQLVAEVEALSMELNRLSLATDAELTWHRQCSRCSGAGKSAGEDPCIECGGKGSVHADEADG